MMTDLQVRRKAKRRGADHQIHYLAYIFICTNVLLLILVYNIAASVDAETNGPPSKVVNKVDGALHTTRTTSTPLSSKDNLNRTAAFAQFLHDNPHTPGARLVHLLQTVLHANPGDEAARLHACREKNFPVCFAGHAAARLASDQAPDDKKDNMLYLERTTYMPSLKEQHQSEPSRFPMSIWNMRRFAAFENDEKKKLRLIHNLGTEPACLALYLAGASVGSGVAVELGTYLGLSSKCISLGLNTTDQTDSYYAFDLFGNDDFNHDKIVKQMPWVLDIMPDFKKESSYLWLWKAATQQAYPTAKAFSGFIDATTLYPKIWHKQPIDLISVDSAKTWTAFRDQTAGIQRPYMLKKGAILILMDYITIDTQIKLVLCDCLGQFLQPVYSSFCRGEQWIFVATQSFSLGMLGACIQDFLGDNVDEPSEMQYQRMVSRAHEQVDFLDGLYSSTSLQMEDERKCLMEKLEHELRDSSWKFLRIQ